MLTYLLEVNVMKRLNIICVFLYNYRGINDEIDNIYIKKNLKKRSYEK